MHISCLFIFFLVHIGESTFATILSVKMSSHEDTSPTLSARTFPSQSLDLADIINLVELQHSQFHFFLFVLNFLRGGVILLLSLLSSSTKTQYQVKGGLLLDVVVRKCAAVFKLFPSKD